MELFHINLVSEPIERPSRATALIRLAQNARAKLAKGVRIESHLTPVLGLICVMTKVDLFKMLLFSYGLITAANTFVILRNAAIFPAQR